MWVPTSTVIRQKYTLRQKNVIFVVTNTQFFLIFHSLT